MKVPFNKKSYLNQAAVVALAGLMTLTPDAIAQSSDDEVIVTARKRAESLLEVPVAITAFSAAELEAAAIVSLGDILDATPGAVYNERDGNRASGVGGFRGVKTFASIDPTQQRTSTFIDGLPMIGPQATIQLVDIEGVEVYRGPQSAVFGRSVFAGAINYTTRKPDLQETHAGVNAEIGEDGTYGLNGYFTTPLIEDQLSFLVSGAWDSYNGPGSPRSTDGFRLGDRETQYGSASLLWEPTDNLSLKARYSHTELDDGPAADFNLDPGDPLNQFEQIGNFAPLLVGELQVPDDLVFDRNFCVNEGLANQNCTDDPGYELERDRFEFHADYEMDNGHSLSFQAFYSEDTTFDIDDQDNTGLTGLATVLDDNGDPVINADTGSAFTYPVFTVNMGIDQDIEEKYAEVVWTSPDDSRLRYTLGASIYDYTFEAAERTIHPSASLDGVGTAPNLSNQDVENLGVFAGVFYDLTEKATLSLEGRYQRDDVSTDDPDPTDDNVPEAITNTFLPRVSLDYQFTDDLNVYGQVAKGVQPATVNVQAVSTTQRETAAALEGLVVNGVTIQNSATPFLDSVVAVDEEEIWSYELGFKGQFLDGDLKVNGAAFYLDWQGFSSVANLFFIPDGGGDFTDIDVLNALEAVGTATNNPALQNLGPTSLRVRGAANLGDISIKGIELDAAYRLNDNWEFQGALTFLDHEFEEACVPQGTDFGFNNNTLQLPGGGTLDCTVVDGNPFLYTPDFQATGSVTYTRPITDDWELFSRGDIRFEDEQNVFFFDRGFLPSSTRLDARIGFSNDTFRIEGYINNITDNDTPTGGQYEPARNQVAAFRTGATNVGRGSPPQNTGLNVAIPRPRQVGIRLGYKY